MEIQKKSSDHLKEVQQSYWTHAAFAIKWGWFLIWTGFVSILHGLIPAVFPFTAPRNILKVAKMIEQREHDLNGSGPN